jgi:hypothetical protein
MTSDLSYKLKTNLSWSFFAFLGMTLTCDLWHKHFRKPYGVLRASIPYLTLFVKLDLWPRNTTPSGPTPRCEVPLDFSKGTELNNTLLVSLTTFAIWPPSINPADSIPTLGLSLKSWAETIGDWLVTLWSPSTLFPLKPSYI